MWARVYGRNGRMKLVKVKPEIPTQDCFGEKGNYKHTVWWWSECQSLIYGLYIDLIYQNLQHNNNIPEWKTKQWHYTSVVSWDKTKDILASSSSRITLRLPQKWLVSWTMRCTSKQLRAEQLSKKIANFVTYSLQKKREKNGKVSLFTDPLPRDPPSVSKTSSDCVYMYFFVPESLQTNRDEQLFGIIFIYKSPI